MNIVLIPSYSGDKGYIEFVSIYLQKLSSDHKNRYSLQFNISSPSGTSINGSIAGVYNEDNNMYLYSKWNEGSIKIENGDGILTEHGIEVDPGQYIITISLIEKISESKS